MLDVGLLVAIMLLPALAPATFMLDTDPPPAPDDDDVEEVEEEEEEVVLEEVDDTSVDVPWDASDSGMTGGWFDDGCRCCCERFICE